MTPCPRVFISFSSRDIAFARELFDSLMRQPVDVWDYSQRGEEIPVGSPIPTYLREQIAASDYFVPLLSANSTDPAIGRFTTLEVRHAIDCGMLQQHRIIPVVLTDREPGSLGGPYDELRDTMHLDVDTRDWRSLEGLVQRLCGVLSLDYVPWIPDHPRLPFAERLRAELRDSDLSRAEYRDLGTLVAEFTRAFADGRWRAALELVTYFVMACRYRLPSSAPYYPLIVKGVCELQLGLLAEAETTFRQAVQHPRHDENGVGGLGHVYFRQKRHDEALAAYEKALAICPKGEELEIRFNILSTRVELNGHELDPGVLADFDTEQLPPEEKLDVLNLRGLVAYRQGKLADAARHFSLMRQQGIYDTTSLLYHCSALRDARRCDEAVLLLESEAEKRKDTNVYHYLADLYLKTGKVPAALTLYERKLCPDPVRGRQFTIEFARVLYATAGKAKLREVCERVLDRRHFRNPATPEDFFYDGFANYLLGNLDRARYDYERSAGFCKTYYDELLRQQTDCRKP
ncbi:MAG: tetratricopeptide repeat protein [candidate division WOR-3 bacterium]|nr:tetratricopeptide repeat protein [candidate division WOR-3 bacterium]